MGPLWDPGKQGEGRADSRHAQPGDSLLNTFVHT